MRRFCGFMSMILVLTCLITMMTAVTDTAYAAVTSETYTVPNGSFDEKISFLKSVFPDGWYWNEWSESKLGSYKMKEITINGHKTTITTKPCASHKGGSIDESCNRYWGTMHGTQCCGYARMIYELVWGYDTFSSQTITYKYPDCIDYIDNVKPGDQIWTGTHYTFVLGVDGENVRVTDCNGKWTCGIRWSATYKKSALKKAMQNNKKGKICVPSTRDNEPEVEPNWVKYEVVYSSGLRLRASAGTSATVVELMPKGTVFKADLNRTKTANGYTWAYCQMDSGVSGWAAISNPDHCKEFIETAWAREYYLNAVFHCTQKTLKSEPYSSSADIRAMSGDEYVVTVAAYRNSYGNLWYELDEGGFVNENNVTYVQSVGTSQYDLPLYYENVINKGTNFALSGTLSSPTDSIWAVGVKIAKRDGSGVIFDVLHYSEKINLNSKIDVSFVNDYLDMYGYSYLDGLPEGEYELMFTPYDYEEEAMPSYSYYFTIANANCNHMRYCDESKCIYCKQAYSGDYIAHRITLVYDEKLHWDLCTSCGLISDVGSHYRYCDEDVCGRCNIDFEETEIYHRELAYVGDEDVHFGYCVSCGYIGVETDHSRKCNQSVCSECGANYNGQNYVHDGLVWSSNNTEHWSVCSDCGYASEREAHERLCDADYCWYCHADYSGKNITHGGLDYVGDESGHYWYCHSCITAMEEKTEHWRWCSETICGECRMSYTGSNVEHTDDLVIDEAVQPTCEADGKTMGSHCPDCGEAVIAQTIIPAKGHTPGEWVIVTPATATQVGYKEIRCKVCAFVLDEKVIPKTESEDDTVADPVVQTVNAKPGDTVTVNVYVSSNHASVVTVQLNHDKTMFELVSTTCEEGQSNNGKFIVYSLDKIINGKIGTATFRVKDTVQEGTYTITVDVVDAFDMDENETGCKAAADKVKVGTSKLGDVSGDGKIDGRDLLRLAKYIGGYDVSIVKENASVNGDSAIDGRDLLRLAKYIGGYDVELK